MNKSRPQSGEILILQTHQGRGLCTFFCRRSRPQKLKDPKLFWREDADILITKQLTLKQNTTVSLITVEAKTLGLKVWIIGHWAFHHL